MSNFNREDIFHGAWGAKLRKSCVCVYGEGIIITSLFGLLDRSGYIHVKHIRQSDQQHLTDMDGFHPDIIFTTTQNIDNTKYVGVPVIWCGFTLDGFMSYGYSSVGRLDVQFADQYSIDKSAALICACSMLLLSQDLQKGKLSEFSQSYHVRDFDGTQINKLAIGTPVLRPNRIMVVGLGALGSHVAMVLALEGLCEQLTLVDFDDIRDHNICRLAMAGLNDVGLQKAGCIASHLESTFNQQCSVIDAPIEEISETKVLEHDIVISCCDRNTARLWLANICRMKPGIRYLQGGFGGSVSQFSIGTEIQELFAPIDEPLNSCTGLILNKTGTPTGATLGTVGILAANMVRFIMSDRCQKEIGKYYYRGFPDFYSEFELPTPPSLGSCFKKNVKLSLSPNTKVEELVHAMSEHFTKEAYIRVDHPFVVDMICPICNKKILVRSYKHVLSDEQRFHPECLSLNPQIKHKPFDSRISIIEDRIHAGSDPSILSMELQNCGFMDGSIRNVYKDGVHLGYICISFSDHCHAATSFQLQFTDQVRQSAMHHAKIIYKESGHEAAGLLFGEIMGSIIRIKKSIGALTSYSSAMYVEICPEWLTDVLSQPTDEEYQFLGWYHSHPGFSISPSGRDILTFKNFRSPQVSVILDPISDSMAAYRYDVDSGDIEQVPFIML